MNSRLRIDHIVMVTYRYVAFLRYLTQVIVTHIILSSRGDKNGCPRLHVTVSVALTTRDDKLTPTKLHRTYCAPAAILATDVGQWASSSRTSGSSSPSIDPGLGLLGTYYKVQDPGGFFLRWPPDAQSKWENNHRSTCSSVNFVWDRTSPARSGRADITVTEVRKAVDHPPKVTPIHRAVCWHSTYCTVME